MPEENITMILRILKSNGMPFKFRILLIRKRKPYDRNRCNVDPYLHLEEELQITRQCLKLIEARFGLAIQTKSARILRDLDILQAINAKNEMRSSK